jgi:hypothetical protein
MHIHPDEVAPALALAERLHERAFRQHSHHVLISTGRGAHVQFWRVHVND